MTAGESPPQLVMVGRSLAGLAPLLRLVTRLRWTLCLVGALQSAAPVWSAGIQPADMVRFSQAGGWILQGRLSEVYATPWMQAGPIELLASWLLYPFPHQHERGYIRNGLDGQYPLRLIGGALIVAGAMLAVRRLRRVHGLPFSPSMELLAGLSAVLIAVPYQFWMGGHLAQFGVPVTWIWAASLAVRGRSTPAGLLIGLSAGWEPWGVLAAGLLLAERRPLPLLKACAAFVAGAVACYLPFVLTGHFQMFELQWAVLPETLIGTFFPTMSTFSWELRLLQGVAAGLAGALTALALGRRRDLIWLGPLAVVTLRLLLDPLILSYYWGPILAAVVVGAGVLHPRCSPARCLLVSALVAVPLLRFRYFTSTGWHLDIPLLALALALLTLTIVAIRTEEPAIR